MELLNSDDHKARPFKSFGSRSFPSSFLAFGHMWSSEDLESKAVSLDPVAGHLCQDWSRSGRCAVGRPRSHKSPLGALIEATGALGRCFFLARKSLKGFKKTKVGGLKGPQAFSLLDFAMTDVVPRKSRVSDEYKQLEKKELLLKENPRRFVMFPLQFPAIWEMYKKHEAIQIGSKIELS